MKALNVVGMYFANLAIGLFNLVRAILFIYHPNGDGWIHSILYCFDCLCNAIVFGDPRETISSRAGKAMQENLAWGCVLCKFLNVFQKDHCLKSIVKEEGSRAILPD